MNQAGRGIGSLTVTLIASDAPVAADGSVPTLVLGTAKTAADGSWSFTAPSVLPAALARVATANGGVLNIIAMASGYVPSSATMMHAQQYLSLGIAKGAQTSSASAAVRADHATAMATMHAALNASTSSPSAVTSDGLSTDASAQLARTDAATADAVPLDNPCSITSSVLSSQIQYTIVGEGHAYADAHTTFTYNTSASTSIGTAASATGSGFSASGSIMQSNYTGASVGFAAQGPYFGHQELAPFNFQKKRYNYNCVHGSSVSYAIEPAGFKVPAGGYTDKTGRDVGFADGPSGYNISNPSYRAILAAGHFNTASQGRSITYQGAVSAFGVGLTAQTVYDTNHQEQIVAGSQNITHHVWGSTGRPPAAGVLYSW